MSSTVFQFVRVIAVIALVCLAAIVATPPGRLPLAIRGLARIMRKDRGLAPADPNQQASLARRLLAFALIVIAAILSLV